MSGHDNSSDGEDTAFEAGREEREALYPDDGFVLAVINTMKPPGSALEWAGRSLVLSNISIPPSNEWAEYVVYDADGHAYSRSTLQNVVDEPDEDQTNELVADLQSTDRREKRLALYGLHEIAEEQPATCLDVLPQLIQYLRGSDVEPDIQAASLAILGTVSEEYPEHVIPVADDVLSLLDPDSDARLHPDAIQVVAAIADRNPDAVVDGVPKLAALLQDDPPAEQILITAVTRIAVAYPAAVVPVASELVTYLEEGDDAQRIRAIAGVGAISKEYPEVAESTIPTAVELLESDRARLRANAAGLLAELAEEYPEHVQDAVPRVIELLADEDQKARYNATSILARVAKAHPAALDGAVEPLLDALDEEFPYARSNACWALGYVGAERALEPLEDIRNTDPNEEVQNAATAAINEITDR